jgi:DNA invertase Pin-like site-specific DNA recombinase
MDSVKAETAISLIGVVMEALVHRETCLKGVQGDVPRELLAAAFAELEANDRNTSETRVWLSAHGVDLPPGVGTVYHRRANNQISAQTEILLRDLLDRGWTKTAIAESLRINRRVVIRVAREALSAQNSQE